MATSRRALRTAPVEAGGPDQIQEAWRMLAGAAPDAVQTLADISRFGRSEVARVQASQTILDRIGLGARPEIVVRTVPTEYDQGGGVDTTASPALQIARRLEQLERAQIEMNEAEDASIVDAELVSEWGAARSPVVGDVVDALPVHDDEPSARPGP